MEEPVYMEQGCSSNLVFTRNQYGFSIDTKKIFFEGQNINFVTSGGKIFFNYEIVSILTLERYVILQNGSDIKRIKMDNIVALDFYDRRKSTFILSQHFDEFVATKSVFEFSLDGINWYSEGQQISFVYDGKEYENAMIETICDTSHMIVSSNGKTFTCNLEYIQNLDYVERRRLSA